MSDEREQAKSGGGNCRSENAPPPSSVSQPVIDRLECPICMLILPLRGDDLVYMLCCGKIICKGCIHADLLARAKPDSEGGGWVSCAFCRSKPPSDDREIVSRHRHQIDLHDDVVAMCQLGHFYSVGTMGLPKSRKKAMEMFKRAYELGSHEAAYCLACMCDPKTAGAEGDIKKSREYAEEAVTRGSVLGRVQLGRLENAVRNFKAAGQHFMIAACAGDDEALNAMKIILSTWIYNKG